MRTRSNNTARQTATTARSWNGPLARRRNQQGRRQEGASNRKLSSAAPAGSGRAAEALMQQHRRPIAFACALKLTLGSATIQCEAFRPADENPRADTADLCSVDCFASLRTRALRSPSCPLAGAPSSFRVRLVCVRVLSGRSSCVRFAVAYSECRSMPRSWPSWCPSRAPVSALEEREVFAEKSPSCTKQLPLMTRS